MITECKPKSDTKFQVLIKTPDKDEPGGRIYRRLTNICGQDLADIIESATKTPGTEVEICREV